MNGNKQITNILFISFISVLATFLLATLSFVIFQNKIPSINELWNQWDTKWYIEIAEHGYINTGEGRLSITFLPLYPWLIRLLATLSRDYLASALVISNVSFIFALILFYKLVRVDFSQEIALRTILFFSIFPTSYFLHAGYAESLFLVLALTSIFLLRKGMWFGGALAGMFASFTRFNGLTLFPFFIIEYLTAKKFSLKTVKYDILWALLILVGFGFYLLLNYRISGNPFYFKAVFEEVMWERASLPWAGLIDAINRFHRYQLADWATEGFIVIAFWIFNLVVLSTSLNKIRLSYKIFAWLNFFLMTTASIWSSLPRYSLMILPIFIVLARWGKNPAINYLITFIFLSLHLIFLALFVRGHWAF